MPTTLSPPYAPLDSPAFTGSPTAPTPAVGNNSTKLATTAYVTAAALTGVAILKPSGDATGVTDNAAINGALTALPRVILDTGAWFVTGVSTTASDRWLSGCGTATVVNALSGDTAITATGASRLHISDMAVEGGAIGIYLNGAGDSQVENIYMTGQSTAGIKVNGDAATEINFENIVLRDVGGSAFLYNKTSNTDTGGIYLSKVRCLRVTTGTKGFDISCTVADSTAFVYMENCVADSYVDDACSVINIAHTSYTDCFFTCAAATPTLKAALRISGGYDHSMSGCFTATSSASGTAYAVKLEGSAHEVLMTNHTFDGSGTNVALGLASFGSALRLGTYYNYLATFTDTPTKITSLAGTAIQAPFNMYTDGSGGGSDCFTMTDSSSTTTKKYIRNSGGNLQVLNSAFSAAIFAIADSGDVTVTGRVSAARFASTVATITYSASMTPDSSLGKFQKITVTNATAMTINAPTNVATGAELVVDILNSSGGAMGVITWNAAFKMAGAFTNPASTKRRTISFYYDGTSWIELNRAAADI